MEIKSAAIVGMGALGMLYGTQMMDSGADIHYVMDSSRIEKYRNRVFYVNDNIYKMPIRSRIDATPADLVIVAVKYPGLEDAMENIAPCVGENTIILSVLNGITSEEILSARFGREHLIYTVSHGADAMKFGERMRYTVKGELRIGAREECQRKHLAAVKAFLDGCGIDCRIDADIMHRLWSKWMLNVGVNQCCMVYETGYGGCLSPGEANRSMIAAMREVISLARAEGIALDDSDMNEYMNILRTLSPESMPSMAQDALQKRPSEVELFSGTVIARAKRHGIYVPTNEFLYERIRKIERGYGMNHLK